MQFERIASAGPYQVDFIDGPGADLVVAFSSIGADPTRCPPPEFVATAIGRGTGAQRRALFVCDAGRSWANDAHFAPVLTTALAQVAARRPVERVATIGLSMGAVSALIAVQVMPVAFVLAFGPQVSVVPGVVPGETRWSEWTERIAPIRWPRTPLPDSGQGRAMLLHGGRDDLDHALRFEPRAGTDQVIFPELGHSDLVPYLKARGALAGLLEAGLDGDRRRALRIAASAGGRLREKLYR